MKKIAALAAVLALGLSACSQTATQQRVTTGAAVGALGGAAVGAIAGGGKGALIGAAVGGIGGAAVAGATAPKNCVAYDAYGRPYAVVCP
ncbi:YMGG-like glycine zipper-containing protein [Oryzibacter oryziterrae]|uniref:YMGG-like glycine zipper-containing protein n=1 Tax=Oryzibacter oryziterrae TaxID=2766474 RepID=UPI001F1A8C69|nr:YMGG-like glycine zipper-containing protein [Oryzibacter oryziterrae]